MDKISFQIIDVSSDDIPETEDSEWPKEFIITLYGKTKDKQNVVCHVKGFFPYFYMRLPSSWGKSYLQTFLEKIIKIHRNGYMRDKIDIRKYKNFYGLNWDHEHNKVSKYDYAKIPFQSFLDMRKCSQKIEAYYNENIREVKSGEKKVMDKLHEWFSIENNVECIGNLYESNTHPSLRFLHEHDIDPCGWVDVSIHRHELLKSEDEKLFNVDIEIDKISSKYITPSNSQSVAPFITASFDIECDSSHGDFPNPYKNFQALSIDIHESYFKNNLYNEVYGQEFKLKHIKRCITDAFLEVPKIVKKIFTQENKVPSPESLDLVMSLFTDEFMYELDHSKETTKKRDSCIKSLTKILNKLEDTQSERLLVKGDPIIQIGTVFHRYGDKECFKKTMVIIGNEDKPNEKVCDDIPGVDVYECSTETELLLCWKNIMLHYNPDLLTGYNIFGFDFDYISKRVDYLFPCSSKCLRKCCPTCPKHQFYRFGRLMRNRESDRVYSLPHKNTEKLTLGYYNHYYDKQCKIQRKELSSSGLGDNILKYISMDGRVVFDIQKEIQKGHSLESYKLDNVSAHFMKGKILSKMIMPKTTKFPTRRTILETNTLGNLKVNDYITLQLHTKYGSVKYRDNHKFRIIRLNHSLQKIQIEEGVSIHEYEKDLISYDWCLSKDDVSPQQIFDFHKHGGSSGRAKVAKYCIMDCELCIHLLQLLDLIPNNMGMASVSSVPLSYIFLRGQGVKINSIIVKECSKLHTRIPKLAPNRKPQEELLSWYSKGDRSKEKLRKAIIWFNYNYSYYKKSKDYQEKKLLLNESSRTSMIDQVRLLSDRHDITDNTTLSECHTDDLIDLILINQRIQGDIGSNTGLKYGCEDWRLRNIQEDVMEPSLDDGFEGAIVLEPTPGIYSEDPIAVVDYASLYPNSIREKNLSHETFIGTQEDITNDPRMKQLLDTGIIPYNKISYDDYNYVQKGKTVHKIKAETQTTCYFTKQSSGKGIIPIILETLLDQRKLTRKRMKDPNISEFQKKVLDGLQLAYKVTANSVYGQMGARTSSICFKKIAACTTSIGRERIYDAKDGVMEWAKIHKYHPPEVIYGDTDSIFIKFSRLHRDTGILLKDKEALQYCIDCGIEFGEWLTKHKLNIGFEGDNKPQDLEYEKTFYPFILISKKRYTGDKYEFSADLLKERTSMGIVMKRRDNAAIVKYVFGNVVEIIMNQKSIDKAMIWLEKTLEKIIKGEIDTSMFIISKSLSAYYKNPDGIAHKVLADRMGERNPGDKPKPNDRIPFMYMKVDESPIHNGYFKNGKPKLLKRKILQGDRIEHPDFIKEQGLEIDYRFYISNQIMNPVKQILDLSKSEEETTALFKKFI